ncbi:aldehyde dehydrogenase [soil metagenome]
MSTGLLQKLIQQRSYFSSGATKSYAFRKEQLQKLRTAVLAHEEALYDALYIDLKKSREETWVTETGFFIAELNDAIRNLRGWMQPEKVKTNLLNLPSSSYTMSEPLGVVLTIGPWNYPLQLLFTPLIGAIAAGNCVVLKPSEFAPATAAVMKDIITKTFDEAYILFVEGDGATVVPEMMNNFIFDHVFYTGSTAVGKLIYQMAAKNLVPVALELGGKSPCIVESDANIDIAARRIAVTKFSNCGQMCVAPDYILVHDSVKDKLTDALKKVITKFYSDDPSTTYSYGKIINERQFNRLVNYLSDGDIIYGGNYDAAKLYMSPTLLNNVSLASPVMQEEIFGPVLPIIAFQTKEEALNIVQQHKNPLAFYVFTQSKAKEQDWLNSVAFGGGCVNNAGWHLTNYHLPFGGRGFSGTGNYHGRFSFNTFSHKKAMMKTPTWFDPDIKYPPFKGKLKLFKWVIK